MFSLFNGADASYESVPEFVVRFHELYKSEASFSWKTSARKLPLSAKMKTACARDRVFAGKRFWCDEKPSAGLLVASGRHMMWAAITTSSKKDKDANSCVWNIARGGEGEKTRMERWMLGSFLAHLAGG